MSSRTRSWLLTGGLALVALVVAHNLIFLAGYGPAYALVLEATGHGGAWSMAVVTVLAGALVVMAIAGAQLRRLSRQAREVPGGVGQTPSWRWFAARWFLLGLRLSALVCLGFVLQENVEHLQIGAPLPLAGVLASRDYPNAIPIIAVVAYVVALVAALFGWQLERLGARLRAARSRHPIAVRSRWAIPDIDRRPMAVRGPGLAGRAPPASAIA